MQRTCEQCGVPFEARSRRARFCGTPCRMRANYDRTRGGAPAPPAALRPTEPGQRRWLVLPVVEDHLAAAGLADSPQGRTALQLAERLDAVTSAESPSAVAALARELSRTLDAIGRSAAVADNPLTRLRLRHLAGRTAAAAEAG